MTKLLQAVARSKSLAGAPSAGPDSLYDNAKRDINTIQQGIDGLLSGGKSEDDPEVKELRRAQAVHRRRLKNITVRTY